MQHHRGDGQSPFVKIKAINIRHKTNGASLVTMMNASDPRILQMGRNDNNDKNKNSSLEQGEYIDDFIVKYGVMLRKISFGNVAGFFSGYAIKKAG